MLFIVSWERSWPGSQPPRKSGISKSKTKNKGVVASTGSCHGILGGAPSASAAAAAAISRGGSIGGGGGGEGCAVSSGSSLVASSTITLSSPAFCPPSLPTTSTGQVASCSKASGGGVFAGEVAKAFFPTLPDYLGRSLPPCSLCA
jgi:hypothetical protein